MYQEEEKMSSGFGLRGSRSIEELPHSARKPTHRASTVRDVPVATSGGGGGGSHGSLSSSGGGGGGGGRSRKAEGCGDGDDTATTTGGGGIKGFFSGLTFLTRASGASTQSQTRRRPTLGLTVSNNTNNSVGSIDMSGDTFGAYRGPALSGASRLNSLSADGSLKRHGGLQRRVSSVSERDMSSLTA